MCIYLVLIESELPKGKVVVMAEVEELVCIRTLYWFEHILLRIRIRLYRLEPDLAMCKLVALLGIQYQS